MEANAIAYSVSSCSDSILEASKDYVIKLMVEEEGVPTIRRIRLFRIVDPQGKISYEKLVRLVSSKIRYMHSHDVRLSYLDVDEDCVVVDSSDELMDAIDQFHDQQVLRLFVGEVTTAMRQAYLAHAPNGIMAAKKLLANSNGGDIEQIIERQIEIVLEKRFRLLEQKRREQENGGRAVNVNSEQIPPTPSLLQQRGGGLGVQPLLPHHHPAARRSPQQQQHQQQSTPTQQHLRRHSFGSGTMQDNSEGWVHSPIRLDEYMDEATEVLGEEDFLPNKNNTRAMSRVRLSWETPDETMRPPRPRKQGGTPIGGNYPVGNYGFDHDDYDLSRNRGGANNHRQKPPVRRNNRNHPNLDSPVIPALPATKRINISRDPAQTLDPRYPMDPSPKSSSPTKHKYRSPSPIDHQSVNDSLVSYRDDDDDFHPDEDDYDDQDEDLADSDDELDLQSDLGESISPNQRIRQPATASARSANDDSRYLQDWETNTVDSDAELSLLLSDTDFRDHVDSRNDTAGREPLQTTVVEERRDPSDDDQSRQSSSGSRQQADDQNRDPSPSSQPPTPRARPLQPQQQSRQQQQQGRLQPPTPIKTPKTPTKASTPKSGASTPTTSNTKPPVAARNSFNNIPRPTPPSQKKNKLLGILYNSE